MTRTWSRVLFELSRNTRLIGCTSGFLCFLGPVWAGYIALRTKCLFALERWLEHNATRAAFPCTHSLPYFLAHWVANNFRTSCQNLAAANSYKDDWPHQQAAFSGPSQTSKWKRPIRFTRAGTFNFLHSADYLLGGLAYLYPLTIELFSPNFMPLTSCYTH